MPVFRVEASARVLQWVEADDISQACERATENRGAWEIDADAQLKAEHIIRAEICPEEDPSEPRVSPGYVV